ncbi:MAG: phosphoribosylformylglycinamidine synthase I [Candidatus Levybacteria bacterium]|nr:phosphoribosylformylglycinamidine synthase I [Candidatus Levybacteria bacterium]MBI3069709.1 phosphoribosylformylglycinamidine synthase I [Candidatus Levybacteria bacterium]
MKERRPQVCVLKTDGINCDQETHGAFDIAGGKPRIVHVNELREREDALKRYQILALPGGFSYGDDIASGKILALELTSYLADQINDFINHGGLVLGVCNGFQVLVRTGLLPFGTMGEIQATLNKNDSGHFECRWINLKIEPNSRCVFLNNRAIEQFSNGISYQVAHGEGKFFASNETMQAIEQSSLVVFRYVDKKGNPTQKYPENPNGALHAIAGICDPTGRILGLMPHPERFVRREQHPNWRRMPDLEPHGLPLFQKMVTYAAQM